MPTAAPQSVLNQAVERMQKKLQFIENENSKVHTNMINNLAAMEQIQYMK